MQRLPPELLLETLSLMNEINIIRLGNINCEWRELTNHDWLIQQFNHTMFRERKEFNFKIIHSYSEQILNKELLNDHYYDSVPENVNKMLLWILIYDLICHYLVDSPEQKMPIFTCKKNITNKVWRQVIFGSTFYQKLWYYLNQKLQHANHKMTKMQFATEIKKRTFLINMPIIIKVAVKILQRYPQHHDIVIDTSFFKLSTPNPYITQFKRLFHDLI